VNRRCSLFLFLRKEYKILIRGVDIMVEVLRDEKVLIVDDAPDILKLLHIVLKKNKFTNVLLAKTGAEAIEVWEKEQPALILLDIMLPDMTGFDVCKHIRKTSSVPIMFLSAMTEEEDRLESFFSGGDDYIAKPFSPKEVVCRVEAILKRTKRNSLTGNLIEFDNFKIYRKEEIVKKNGVDVGLSPMELKLFLFLVEHINEEVEKETILREVMDDQSGTYAQTLSVYVHRLREKIEDGPGKPKHIRTVKNVGYKLVGD